MKMRVTSLILGLGLAKASLAGGTLGTEGIELLLNQSPAVKSFLMSSLTMEEGAFADIRLGEHFQHLGGQRLGPYYIQAVPKSPEGAKPVEIVLCTRSSFLDEAGQAIPEGSDLEFSAVRVEEKLTAVFLREATGTYNPAQCPNP
jgi:hypothetical protein